MKQTAIPYQIRLLLIRQVSIKRQVFFGPDIALIAGDTYCLMRKVLKNKTKYDALER